MGLRLPFTMVREVVQAVRANESKMVLYPNPVTENSVAIDLILSEDSQVEAQVFDMLGRKLKDLFVKDLQAGKHTYPFRTDSFAQGTYLVRVSINGKPHLIRMVVTPTN